jgi:hypothetical protein
MKVVSLSFPGRFEDAFLYMGKLFAITENRSVCIYDMNQITRKLEEDDEALLDVPTHLFCKNELSTSSLFKDRLKDRLNREDFINAVNHLELEQVQITPEYGNSVEWDLEISADIILDLNIYNRRAYIGTNKGLYHLDLHWDSEDIVQIDQPKQRLDAKCVYTTAKCGTVNASCGSEGWVSFLDDFALGVNNTPKEKYKQEYSLRTNWLGLDVVNYPTAVSPTLLRSIVSNASKEISDEYDSKQRGRIVTDIQDKELKLDSLFSNLESYREFNLDNIQFISNSSSALFINTYDSGLFALGLNKETHTFNYANKYEGMNEIVSSLHTIRIIGGGTIFETEEKVLLFAKRKFIPIFDDEVISIRTFPNSLHYNNIVSITTSEKILLISIFDDDIF